MFFSKLLFGASAVESVQLTITISSTTSPLPASLPALTVRSQHSGTFAVPFLDGRWQVTLEKGDHLIQLTVTRNAWFDSPLHCSFSAPVKIVVPRDLDDGPLVGWTDSVGIAGDPKNPWPPPSINAVACDQVGSSWLRQSFASQVDSVDVQRG